MSKYLVILESPGKIKKVKNYLGKDYDVVASMGHIADLPSKGLNVDIKNDFEPTYKVNPDKKDVVKDIKTRAKKAKIVYLMMDKDREGSGIAYHIKNQLPKNTIVKRAITGSITKEAILEAIENAGEINMAMVNAYEARRILDRICGYKCSFITKQATGGRSAGRVQSSALRILAEREKEIKSFIPQEYWPIEADLETNNKDVITAQIKKPKPLEIKNEKQAKEICDFIEDNDIKVSKFETKDVSLNCYAPFTTSSLYQSASGVLGWGANKTASVAQNLYQEGLITYIRTDSTYIVPDFISEIRSTISSKYGSSYCPNKSNFYANKKNAQEAHEAIRVTDLSNELGPTGDEGKLYKVIWKRTVASQMAKALQIRNSAEFKCGKYLLSATGSKLKFDGWKKCWNYGKNEDNELSVLKVGEKVKLLKLKKEQKFTQPPSRYNDASIIKKLETTGIGRPSTYKTIIKTLLDREYIERQKKAFHVTDIGIKVVDFLVESDFCFVDLKFTSNLESQLDDIANDSLDKVEALSKFWKRLKGDIENAKIIKDEKEKSDYDCPKCKDGSKLVLKHSKWGAFLTCENRTNKEIKCEYKADVGKNGEPVEKQKKEVNYSDEFKCPNCGEFLVIRTNKKNGGLYLGCKSWKQKLCQGFYNAETGELIKPKKKKAWGKKKYKKKKKKD